MEINRELVKETFQNYTDAYDSSDEKIRLKIAHTYRVAGLCERIARAEGMSEEDVGLAWLLGMLHDVGRFEQLRRYGTFLDARSVNHAALGADILFSDGKIREYLADAQEDVRIETAIRLHNVYRLPEKLDARTKRLANVLRDADKIDILRVNVEVPMEEILDVTTGQLRCCEVSGEVMESFFTHSATLWSIRRTAADHVVGYISLVFELVFPESFRITQEQGYLNSLLHFESRNPKTREQFAVLREEMERYLGMRKR